MIKNEEVFKIGFITKQRGLRGEVEMSFTDDCFDNGTADYFVLDIDGIFVPFFWEEFSFKNNDTLIIKFEDIDNEKQSSILVGRSVFYPKQHVQVSDNEDGATLSSYKALTGFSVFDQHQIAVGTIIEVDDSSSNILLTIEKSDGNDLLLPFHNDFLLHFDLQERFIQLHIPEELLSLND